MRRKILDKIAEFDDIIIIPHIRPDGDCFGASFGLKYIIEDMHPDKRIYVVGTHYRDTTFMGETVEVPDELFPKSLVISVDTGSLDRVYDQRVLNGAYVIRIDHHPHVEDYGDLQYIAPEFPSTCTIVTDICRKFEIPISQKAAECLYFGTVTDTGRFKFRGVNGNTHRNIGYLLDTNIDTDKLLFLIYSKDIETMRLDGKIFSMVENSPNGLLYLRLTKKGMKKLGITSEDAGKIISKLEYINEYPVWAVFYELDDKFIRGRLRSRGPVINEVAANYHGGGHSLAAGATLRTWKEVDSLVNDLDKEITIYKENMAK